MPIPLPLAQGEASRAALTTDGPVVLAACLATAVGADDAACGGRRDRAMARDWRRRPITHTPQVHR